MSLSSALIITWSPGTILELVALACNLCRLYFRLSTVISLALLSTRDKSSNLFPNSLGPVALSAVCNGSFIRRPVISKCGVKEVLVDTVALLCTWGPTVT